ncbi:glycosyltransferase [Polaribacter sp. L3A8]|uniref:glycosyltransferase n=1 Tax=Polaribacter sp. L3A8 TaxID=2686361 RepID=UPI00131BADC2|nr:glycosyltransferase [Polaribacter sp. L3A8]
MKVLLVNTYDRGGAANACIRLHKGLLQEGMESNVLLRTASKNIPFTYVASPIDKQVKHSIYKKIKLKATKILKELKLLKVKPQKTNKFLINRDARLEMFSYPNSNFDITESELYKEADIINLHWVSNFLDYASFFKKNKKPVIWTLHDMNPFTGGEHYLEDFLGIDESGKPKKRSVTEIEKKEFLKNLKIKKEALQNVSNLHIVTLCTWMSEEVKKSELFKNYPIHLIPNGLDTTIFKPIDQKYSREVLGLPQDKKIVLFVSDSISNNRKGFVFLKNALELVKRKDVILCAIGRKNENLKEDNNIIELGVIHDERLMSVVYNAVDVFVIPSLMDNLPNTAIESLLCGTPVIGFPKGGITDIIEHGVNGYLTEDISVKSLVIQLNIFLDTSKIFNSVNIRDNAIKKYSLQVQATSYIKLFNKLVEC